MKHHDIVALVGAGGHAREIYHSRSALRIDVVAVYSEVPADHGRMFHRMFRSLIVQRLPSEPHPSVNYVLAIGDPQVRRRLWDRGFRANCVCTSLRNHESLSFGRMTVGAGSVVMHPHFVGPNVMLGVNVHVLAGAQLHHDVSIDHHAFIGPGAILCGAVKIGAGAFVGAGAVLLPGVSVGPGVVIGAGAVVTKDVPRADDPLVGVPAREMR